MTNKRVRPMMGVSIDPALKAAIDTEADRVGLNRSQMVEALLAPGLQQILSGNYDVVWAGNGFALQRRQVQG